jgi:hypothetical protein
MLFLVNNLLAKRKCESIRRCDAPASSSVAKVRAEVFTNFHAVAVNSHSSMRIDCLVCQEAFLT